MKSYLAKVKEITYGRLSVAYMYYLVTKDYIYSVSPPLSMLDS